LKLQKPKWIPFMPWRGNMVFRSKAPWRKNKR
jgi:hypothetical protein